MSDPCGTTAGMTNELNRLAMWSLVDELVTRIYRVADRLKDEGHRALLKHAALSLAEPAPTEVVQEKLIVISAMLESASYFQPRLTRELQLVDTAIADTSAALRRLESSSPAACQ